MKIEIESKLKYPEFCDGCCLLELKDSGDNYYSKCKHPKNYKVNRISLTREEMRSKFGIIYLTHPDLIASYKTQRSELCKKDNGTLNYK